MKNGVVRLGLEPAVAAHAGIPTKVVRRTWWHQEMGIFFPIRAMIHNTARTQDR